MTLKKSVITLTKLIFSAAIIIYILNIIDLDSFDWSTLKIPFKSTVILILLFFATFYVRAIRWYIIVNDQVFSNDPKVKVITSFKFLLIGTYLNLFLPSGSGDIAKGYFASKELGNKYRMYLTSIFDKTIAIASLFFISIICSFQAGDYNILLAGLLCTIPFLVIIYRKKIFTLRIIPTFIKKKSSQIVNDKQLSSYTLLYSFALSLVGWIITYFILYYCFKLVAISIPLEVVFQKAPLITLGRLFPFTLNGIGSDEAILSFLFSDYYDNLVTFLLGALIFRILINIFPAIIGMPFFIFSKNKIDESN